MAMTVTLTVIMTVTVIVTLTVTMTQIDAKQRRQPCCVDIYELIMCWHVVKFGFGIVGVL